MAQEQGNAVDQAQAALDAQQEGKPPAPAAQVPAATTADIERIVTAATRVQQGQIDKGLTAVRRDLMQELETLKADAAMEGLPDEVKVYVQPLVTQMKAMQAQINQGPAPAQTPEMSGDTDLDTFLAGMGLNTNSPGLDLAAHARGDMTTFLASARTAIRGAPNEAPQTPAAQVPPTANPPVGGAPAGGGAAGTVWDAYDLYNTGAITLEEFNQRQALASPEQLNE